MKIRPAVLVVFAASSAFVFGQNKRVVAPEKAAAGSSKLVSEIQWLGVSGNDSAVQAQLSREAKSDNKLIFYMHMLGNIAGNTWSAGESLRAVSLSQDPTFSMLKTDFVCGTRNIVNLPYAGLSGVHPMEGGAVYTTNGAGPHNIQMFVLTPEGIVLNCLPGYWQSDDLASELKFSEDLYKVWKDPSLTMDQKRAKFSQMHLAHINEHSPAMVRRSQMQGFDKKYEIKNRLNTSDTILSLTGGEPKFNGVQFKTTDRIFHERMARRPFLHYNQFDVAAFCDYGRPKYDKKEEGELAPAPKMTKQGNSRPRRGRRGRGGIG